MARDYFDSKGNHRGTSISRKDSVPERIQADFRTDSGSLSFILLVIAFVWAVSPFIFLVSQVYLYLEQLGVHSLFCVLASVGSLVLAVYCLLKFRVLRALYAFMLGVILSVVIFKFVPDVIWAGFFILIVMAAVTWFAREIYLGNLFDV